MPLDETVVPWAALWLYYFEEWLVSDDWKGGGKHRSDLNRERERRRRRSKDALRSLHAAEDIARNVEQDAENG